MDFNNKTDKNGVIQHCEQKLYGDNPFGTISDDPELLAVFTNYLNEARRKYSNLAFRNDDQWVVDDLTNTDYPIAETDLISGQLEYSVPDTFIVFRYIELLRDNDTYKKLEPYTIKDEQNLSNVGVSERPSGVPDKYQKIGAAFLFDKVPDYNKEDGIRVHYQRPLSYYSTDDTNKQSGIPDTLEPYLYTYACAVYAVDKGISNAKNLWEQKTYYEREEIPEYFGSASEDVESRLITLVDSAE